MHLSAPTNLRNQVWIPFFILLAARFLPSGMPDPRISVAAFNCSQSRAPTNGSYVPLFTSAMEGLGQRVMADEWGEYIANSTSIPIYTFFQCHGDLTRDDCLQCYAATRTSIPRCVPAVSGRIFLDGCFLRYDRYEFYNQSVDAALDRVNCNTTLGAASGVDLEFERNVRALIDNLTASAVENEGYAVRDSRRVFGLAECWNTGRPGYERRLLLEVRFFLNSTDGAESDSGVSGAGLILAITLPVVAFTMLCVFGNYAVYSRWRKRKQERENLGKISYSYNRSNLNFKYETLEKATNYFDLSRKLGQGGAGSVYKGTLPNGKTVAVKRLFFSTRQWVDEFFNEVNLISGIEHKNLVKLLGCSIEGPESLLVYEFVPNRSLEEHLFDTSKSRTLSWKERYNIIVGTAEGIAFLHGGCEHRIIHRDIKSSNILLDENFEPKIADFGLARGFAADKTHLSTGIAGTLGYMAPEYLVKGQLTEKADVYSYGVLVLEIVCSRKNNAFMEGSGSLLQAVWNHFKTDRLPEAVDPCLKGEFPAMEASKALKIGLLCAQASVTERPSMAEVVQMLTNENYEIPEPKQPPFLQTHPFSTSSTGSSSYSINSLNSNVMRKYEASYRSTESSSIQSSDVQSKSEYFGSRVS
ncbi:Cysteine-rich receptor-like protein kinase 42 [Striga hermonthica]|uniref:Cysteine-rich receptor-like protein kinase 42 n=1 Tax=Striga hermonthica TaxID=68872 RepID=A0A9N7RHW4_STRHE|nr:Cysteine-rich receptor-like protein kinase 42 [Striga hermonthica]